MEPAVTSCPSQGSSTNGFRVEKGRRNANDYLNIDPSSTFLSNSSRIEEFPDNFLETISPQQTNAPLNSLLHGETATSSPQLAPLAPMAIGTEQSFGNGPAGLLSPLHMDGRRHSVGSEYRGVYIKEETDLDATHHLMMSSSQIIGAQHQAELDRANAETPPAVSNVELASNMIASMIGDQGDSSPSPHYSSGPSGSMLISRLTTIKTDDESLDGASHANGDHAVNGEPTIYKPAYNKGKRTYSTKDTSDPLNAEIDDDIYIDTKELCKRIAYELKQHSIPQAIFAERILCRSQGTLSDLLRNPKPWNKLKSGRETFRRMFNWVRQPVAVRLGILDMFNKELDGENGAAKMGMSPPTPAQNVRHHTRARNSGLPGDGEPSNKRPRLVFTDIQKRTLQAIFKETQRPSREMQQTIAEHLRLDLSTVANFFMNARRRSRIGPGNDEPAPYQQVRPITPPPDSPPRISPAAPRNRPNARQPANMSLIEQTVSGVAEEAIQYSRKLDEELAASSLQHMHHLGAISYKENLEKLGQLNGDGGEDGGVIVDGEIEGTAEEVEAEEAVGQPDADTQPPVVTYTVPDTPGDELPQTSLAEATLLEKDVKQEPSAKDDAE
ncbi:unnamed protein product, partial [Mesorhabditis belari]|uniref:One cut domain family member n=1 Tax=Mesorhabditis belari TaxID=2138241 RepID=A0AAF3J7V9_9BILA